MKQLMQTTLTNRFRKCEDGSITIFALMFVVIFIIMGGVAIDFNKAMSEKTQLQVAADTAAHAAIYTREFEDVPTSTSKALETIADMLPANQFGANAVLDSDVTFGTWDFDTSQFVADSTSRKAVQVFAQASSDRGNASRNLLLSIVGQDTFDIGVTSVYSTYYPTCFTEGFVADNVVDIQSNNDFSNGFCIHSNDHVSLNQNNYFESGTVVSMPNLNNLDMPSSGFEANEGLQTALRSGEYRIRILRQLPDIINSFWSGSFEHTPDYITDPLMADVSQHPDFTKNGRLTPDMFVPGAINFLTCTGSKAKTMGTTGGGATFSGFVFVTDCPILFGSGVILEEAVIATTNTDIKSFTTNGAIQIGRADNCAPGGGVELLTLGGFHTSAKISVYNGQILALKDIIFSAQANGIYGASFVSLGTISGTSGMDMAYCAGVGMEDAYRAAYFRTVL